MEAPSRINLILTLLTGTQAVEYTVTNNAATTPGGVKFANQIGIEYVNQTLIFARDFVWKTLQQAKRQYKVMTSIMFFFAFLVIKRSLTGTLAVEYTVTNNAATTPGGMKFTNQIGIEYTKQTMSSATDFIWSILRQTTNADRKNIPKVSLSIDSMDGVVAYTSNNGIHVSANYIQQYTGNVKTEFTGVLYHEMTHVWQWRGNGQIPRGLIEGIADFVRLKAGYAPGHWRQPGKGDRWDQGYDVTAWFLDYCEGLRSGFVAEMNKKMRTGYSANYFVELLGKSVDQLWSDYKAKYKTN